jgi:pilus assembly protein Flp/PilA
LKFSIKNFHAFCQNEDGLSLTEYLILLGLLIGGVLIAVELTGINLSIAWNSWGACWTDTVPALADNGRPVCCENAQAAYVPGNCCN